VSKFNERTNGYVELKCETVIVLATMHRDVCIAMQREQVNLMTEKHCLPARHQKRWFKAPVWVEAETLQEAKQRLWDSSKFRAYWELDRAEEVGQAGIEMANDLLKCAALALSDGKETMLVGLFIASRLAQHQDKREPDATQPNPDA
jgi:hypothetical protein